VGQVVEKAFGNHPAPVGDGPQTTRPCRARLWRRTAFLPPDKNTPRQMQRVSANRRSVSPSSGRSFLDNCLPVGRKTPRLAAKPSRAGRAPMHRRERSRIHSLLLEFLSQWRWATHHHFRNHRLHFGNREVRGNTVLREGKLQQQRWRAFCGPWRRRQHQIACSASLSLAKQHRAAGVGTCRCFRTPP
jgi:hypothetical protein